jgi:hypothetical protein
MQTGVVTVSTPYKRRAGLSQWRIGKTIACANTNRHLGSQRCGVAHAPGALLLQVRLQLLHRGLQGGHRGHQAGDGVGETRKCADEDGLFAHAHDDVPTSVHSDGDVAIGGGDGGLPAGTREQQQDRENTEMSHDAMSEVHVTVSSSTKGCI